MTGMEVFLPAPRRTLAAFCAAVAGATMPTMRRFAAGSTTTRTTSAASLASAFVAQPNNVTNLRSLSLSK